MVGQGGGGVDDSEQANCHVVKVNSLLMVWTTEEGLATAQTKLFVSAGPQAGGSCCRTTSSLLSK